MPKRSAREVLAHSPPFAAMGLTLVLGVDFTLAGFRLSRTLEKDRTPAALKSRASDYTNHPQYEADGVVQAVTGLRAFMEPLRGSYDITRRKETEQALRLCEEKFAAAFQHSPLWVWRWPC
jgi:PAS domain-containing protein